MRAPGMAHRAVYRTSRNFDLKRRAADAHTASSVMPQRRCMNHAPTLLWAGGKQLHHPGSNIVSGWRASPVIEAAVAASPRRSSASFTQKCRGGATGARPTVARAIRSRDAHAGATENASCAMVGVSEITGFSVISLRSNISLGSRRRV